MRNRKVLTFSAVAAIFCGVGLASLSFTLRAEEQEKSLLSIAEARLKSTTRKVYKLGETEILVSEGDRVSSGVPGTMGTFSRIETRKNGKKVELLDFKGLDAVGGYTGLMLPRAQSLKGYFLLKKLGNYDTRLILISPSGKILNLPFGTVFLSPPSNASHRILFAVRTSPHETAEFAVVDLKAEAIVLHQSDDPRAVEFDKASRFFKREVKYSFFTRRGKYFAIASEKGSQNPELARELISQANWIRLNDARTEFLVEKKDPALMEGAVSLPEILAQESDWVTFR